MILHAFCQWFDILTSLLLTPSVLHRCEDIERVHKVYQAQDDGTPERHLQVVRDALGGIAPPEGKHETGMTSFEEFCARNYPGGRLYQNESNRGKEDDQKSWNGVSHVGLIKDGMSKKEQAL